MRFAIFKGEKNVNDLASRLFRIQGRGSQTATRQAADALVKANPQLTDLSKVPVGSIIAIPDAAPAVVPGEESISVALIQNFAVQNIRARLDFLEKRFSEIEAAAIDQVKTSLKQAQTPEMKAALKTLAQQSPSLAAMVPSPDNIVKDSKAILKNIQAAQDGRKQAFAQWRAAMGQSAK